jgi:hypothetical protein
VKAGRLRRCGMFQFRARKLRKFTTVRSALWPEVAFQRGKPEPGRLIFFWCLRAGRAQLRLHQRADKASELIELPVLREPGRLARIGYSRKLFSENDRKMG